MTYNQCKVCNGEISDINHRFNLVKCKSCKLVFSKKIYSEDEFVKVYDKLYNDKSDKVQYATHSIKEFKNLLKGKVKIGYNRKLMIKKSIKNGDRVLEIGSGIGLIGFYLKKYSKVNYTGIEIDYETHKKALSLGINSLYGDFSIMKKLEGNYNIIMLWEVLEHLQDVSLFFDLVKKNISKDGTIIFSVPNYNKRKNYDNVGHSKDRLYQSGPPIHLNFFTEESIYKVLNIHNFSLEFIKEKKFPYFNFKSKKIYSQLLKSLFGNYHGSTLYVKAKYQG